MLRCLPGSIPRRVASFEHRSILRYGFMHRVSPPLLQISQRCLTGDAEGGENEGRLQSMMEDAEPENESRGDELLEEVVVRDDGTNEHPHGLDKFNRSEEELPKQNRNDPKLRAWNQGWGEKPDTALDSMRDEPVADASRTNTDALPGTENVKARIQRDGQTKFHFRMPKKRPYSIPEPSLFANMTREEINTRVVGKKFDEIPVATWFADRAGPPLLLTFDAFNTLYAPIRPVSEQYAEIAKKYGYHVRQEEVSNSFNIAYKSLSEQLPMWAIWAGGYRVWWTKLIDHTFQLCSPQWRNNPSEEVTKALLERFSSKSGYEMFPDAIKLLALIGSSWQAKNWPPKRTMLGIISNSDPRVHSILDSFGIRFEADKPRHMYPHRFAPSHSIRAPATGLARFAFLTLSYECTVEKPSTLIYDEALKNAQKTLESLRIVNRLTRTGKDLLTSIDEQFHHMHVGDSVEKDVIPALQAGWDAVLLDRSATQKMEERTVKVSVSGIGKHDYKFPVINNLMGIQQLVTKQRLRAGISARRGIDVPDDILPVSRDPFEQQQEPPEQIDDEINEESFTQNEVEWKEGIVGDEEQTHAWLS